MSRMVTLALAQLVPVEPARSRERSIAVVREAFRGGADVVVLPELAVPGYDIVGPVLRAGAERLDGPTVEGWRAAAREGGGYVAGGFCEEESGQLFNAAVLVDGDGVVGHYRKAHLFSEEKLHLSPGNLGFPVTSTRHGTIGLCVCYDLRFVEVVRLLALQGADLVLVPTAWVAGYDPELEARSPASPRQPARHAPALSGPEGLGTPWPQQVVGLAVQSNLSQVFIAAASFAGASQSTQFLGHSVVAGPYGEVLAGPCAADTEEICYVAVDLDEAAAARTRMPLVKPRDDRRLDLYAIDYLGRRL